MRPDVRYAKGQQSDPKDFLESPKKIFISGNSFNFFFTFWVTCKSTILIS